MPTPTPAARRRFLLAAACLPAALLLGGCEFEQINETVSLSEQQWKTYYYEYDRDAEEVAVEVVHISGTPMSVYVLDKENFTQFENGNSFRYYSALSSEGIRNRYSSGFHRLGYTGLLYVVVRPDDVQDGDWTESRVRVKVTSKFSPVSDG